jgi:feruloyl esterase
MNYKILGLALAVLLGTSELSHADSACEDLKRLKLPDTTITIAESHAAATEEFEARGAPGMVGLPPTKAALPAHCRVAGSIHPTSDSDIRFEVWLPVQNWNHRYQQVGNGGLAGSVPVDSLIVPLQQGWAVAGTDDGHKGDSMDDARWALGHPQKLIDYGYRAVHLTAQRAQAIVKAFYRAKASHAYFIGCSDGGRESLMEAQRYPGDFDGFVAGAPAHDLTGLQIAATYRLQVAASLGNALLSPSLMRTVVDRELAQCDAIDGVKDGVIANPRRCQFDPHQLICQSGETGKCLTAAQADAIQKVYDGPRDPTTGQSMAPGSFDTIGTEVPALGSNARPDRLSAQFFGNIIYDNPNIDPLTLDLVKAERDSRAKIDSIVSPLSVDLGHLRRTGKKLIQYHGWSDPLVPAESSLAYFTSVQRLMGDTQDFYRLFVVPGMGHCGGGVGPTWVTGAAIAPDADHDVVRALTRWVEQSVAPDQIIASQFTNSGANPMAGPDAGTPVKATRPVCAYPQFAKYKGQGSTSDATNFECNHE